MPFRSYSETSPPASGTARRIWRSLRGAGVIIRELHYNPNSRGASANANAGRGTWTGTFEHRSFRERQVTAFSDGQDGRFGIVHETDDDLVRQEAAGHSADGA